MVETISGEDKKQFEGTINTKRGENLVAEYETKASFNPLGSGQSSEAEPQEKQKPPAPNEPMIKDKAPEVKAVEDKPTSTPFTEPLATEKEPEKTIAIKDRKRMFIRKKPEAKTI